MNKLEKIQGTLMGAMLGDAMGLPWEMMSYEKVSKATQGQGITGFGPLEVSTPLGRVSDDWQLTKTVAESLIHCLDFNLLHQALFHLDAYLNTTWGWGRASINGIEEIDDYFSSYGKEGRSPFVAPKPKPAQGLGNGVAMKISPLALWLALKAKQEPLCQPVTLQKNEETEWLMTNCPQLWEWTFALGNLTHSDVRASVAAYAIAVIIFKNLLLNLFSNGETQSSQLDQKEEALWLLKQVILECEVIEKSLPTISQPFSTFVNNLQDKKMLFGDVKTLIERVGNRCIVTESVVLAIAIFLRNPTDFRNGMLEALNALGDVDTISSMVGTMIGSVVGIQKIPSEWREHDISFQQALDVGTRLAASYVISESEK